MFLVWFFPRPISPKEDTTLHLKPIVEAREHVYFLYICIHALPSRSQLPPFLSWFDYLNIFMDSPRILTNHDIQGAHSSVTCTLVSLPCPFSSNVSFVNTEQMNRYTHMHTTNTHKYAITNALSFTHMCMCACIWIHM